MQKVWRITRKIFTILLVTSVVGLFIVSLTSASVWRKELRCTGIHVDIDYDSGLAFLSEKEIIDRLNFLSGENLLGKRISQIDFKTLENEIDKNPYVKNAEVFVNGKQQIIVTIIQNRPILRVLNNDGVGYYISDNNQHLPLHSTFTPHLTMAMGDVITPDSKRDSAVQKQLFELGKELESDHFLNVYIDEIDVQANGEFHLIPKPGSPIVKLGKVDKRTKEKLKKLKIFYKEGLCKLGWERYKTINLKFDNQVVCEKSFQKDTIKNTLIN